MEPRIARRAAASALIAGVAADALFDRTALGISVPLATAATLALVTWFGPGRRPADRLDAWLPVVAILASLGPALRTDPAVVLLDLVLVVASVSAWSFAVSGISVTRRSAAAVADLGARAAGAIAFGLAWLLQRAGADGAFVQGTRNLGRLAPVARGLLIAVPIVIGFTVLLTSADAVFGHVLDDAMRFPFDPVDIVGRGVFAILAAAVVAGPIAIAAGAGALLPGIDARLFASRPIQDDPGAEPGIAAPPPVRAGATEALVILVAVDALFAAFAAVQVMFLFGGADTLAAIGMTYSDYARQGYFQLVGVVALAGVLLLGAHEVVGRTRAFLVAAVALLALTGVILASAALRMGLYQGAYGWTELRFFVTASIVWLAASLVLALGFLAGNRMRWLPHGLAISAVAVTIAVSAIGPEAFVMRQNLARLLDPSLVAPDGNAGLDVDYVLTLGDDAVPDLVAALAVVGTTDRMNLRRLLEERRAELASAAASEGPFSWNLARQQAREALARLPGL